MQFQTINLHSMNITSQKLPFCRFKRLQMTHRVILFETLIICAPSQLNSFWKFALKFNRNIWGRKKKLANFFYGKGQVLGITAKMIYTRFRWQFIARIVSLNIRIRTNLFNTIFVGCSSQWRFTCKSIRLAKMFQNVSKLFFLFEKFNIHKTH